jgi:hypothetical protein
MQMEKTISDKLQQFAFAIRRAIAAGVSSGSLQPELTAGRRWKVDKFHYTDEGITTFGATGEDYTRETWTRASAEAAKSLSKLKEYTVALNCLSGTFSKRNDLKADLELFGRKVIRLCLSSPHVEEPIIDNLLTIFQKNLRGEPVKYGAVIELTGVVLQSDRIDIGDGIFIRKPRKDDMEKEFPGYGVPWLSFPHPTSILNIEILCDRVYEMQKKVEQALAILRLFRVGSVKYLSYQMYTESITDVMASGQLRSGDMVAASHEKYLLKLEDDLKLKNFWLEVCELIPKSFYDVTVTDIDHTTIAYNRYTDALLHNGALERRITNAIMGLEALFFKADGEAQELSYRLRLRMGKVLGLVGFDPHEVSKRIKDAYDIRSTFTHGGHLDNKNKLKLESKYGKPDNLFLSVLDYLRKSIIINLLIGKDKKNEFIDSIDGSLIDTKKESKLTSMYSGAMELLG